MGVRATMRTANNEFTGQARAPPKFLGSANREKYYLPTSPSSFRGGFLLLSYLHHHNIAQL